MGHLLSRYPLKIQIGSIVALAGAVLAICFLVLELARVASDDVRGRLETETIIAQQAASLDSTLLGARRHEKDFLLRKDPMYIAEHARAMSAAGAMLDAMAAAMPADDPRVATVTAVRQAIATYAEAFRKVSEAHTQAGLTEKVGLLGRLRGSVHEVETALKQYDDRLTVLMLMMRRHEKDFLARLDPKYVGELAKRGLEFEQALKSSAVPETERAAILELMTAYQRDFNATAEAILVAAATAKTMAETYGTVQPIVQTLMDDARDRMADAKAEAQADAETTHRVMIGVMSSGFILILAVGMLIARSIYQPLSRMIHLIQGVAAGKLDTDIPHRHRLDEVGDLARAVEIFKCNASEKARMEAEIEAAKSRAAQDRKEEMHQLGSEFEAGVSKVVDDIADASASMEITSQTMSAMADMVTSQAGAVAAASEQAAANVQTVAAATEELSASVSEISRQVAESAKVARNAVTEAAQTDAIVRGLAEAAGRIGEVVTLINDIASQTNLLALNATIEAARAGEAGKGFAVVANEVKSLANQTAKATEEIAQQINAVQTETERAVGAIRNVGGTINRIDEISAAIALAVEQQGAATREIARNVEQAARGTQEVSSNILGITDAAGQAGQSSAAVLGAARGLASESVALRQSVAAFITKVRAS